VRSYALTCSSQLCFLLEAYRHLSTLMRRLNLPPVCSFSFSDSATRPPRVPFLFQIQQPADELIPGQTVPALSLEQVFDRLKQRLKQCSHKATEPTFPCTSACMHGLARCRKGNLHRLHAVPGHHVTYCT